MSRRTYHYSAILTILTLLLVVTCHSPVRTNASPVIPPPSIPKSVRPCLPQNTKNAQALAAATHDAETYYLIHGSFGDSTNSTPNFGGLLLVVDSQGCALVSSQERASTMLQTPLSAYVTGPVARDLSLSRWRQELSRAPSRQALESDLQSGLQEGPDRSTLSPEDIWALRQLGIDLGGAFPKEQN